jgi:hypothetical protein
LNKIAIKAFQFEPITVRAMVKVASFGQAQNFDKVFILCDIQRMTSDLLK